MTPLDIDWLEKNARRFWSWGDSADGTIGNSNSNFFLEIKCYKSGHKPLILLCRDASEETGIEDYIDRRFVPHNIESAEDLMQLCHLLGIT